jgi:uncharacterized protein YprB with RNaseH-like and TPR domain
MLQNTFCHIQGVGAKTEERLWASGIHSWKDASPETLIGIPGKAMTLLPAVLEQSMAALENSNPGYFERLLPPGMVWRLFDHFRDHTAYLDIETDGLDIWSGGITTIALYNGKTVAHYVAGHNLDRFPDDLQHYKVLITYNGKCFDIPFIENVFRIKVDHAHLDLRYILASLGYKGGLKACESALGINRGVMTGLDGWYAPLLWREYKLHDDIKALETLLAYNIEDTVNLENLMVQAYNMKVAETPFNTTHRLSIPPPPHLPFQPDVETVDRMKRRYAHQQPTFNR